MMSENCLSFKANFRAGVDVETAAQAMADTATRLGINIEASFNGILLLASPDRDAEYLLNQYRRQLESSIRNRASRSSHS